MQFLKSKKVVCRGFSDFLYHSEWGTCNAVVVHMFLFLSFYVQMPTARVVLPTSSLPAQSNTLQNSPGLFFLRPAQSMTTPD